MSDLLLFSGVVFVVLASCAYVVGRAGNHFGLRGAVLVAVALWMVLTLALQGYFMLRVDQFLPREPLNHLRYHAVLSLISLFVAVVPMLLSGRLNWMRGRLYLGLIGALVVSVFSLPLIVALGCAMNIDCI